MNRWAPSAADLTVVFKQTDRGVLIVNVPANIEDIESTIVQALSAAPGWSLLALGGEFDDPAILEMIEAGASAYLPVSVPLDSLMSTVKSVFSGTISYPPKLISLVVSRIRHLTSADPHTDSQTSYNLTKREKQVVQLMSEGLANKEIARQLGVSPSTAKNHLHALLRKLKATRRKDAIVKAFEVELLTDYKFPLALDHTRG